MTDDLERLEALAMAAHKWVSMYDSRSSFREPDDPPMPPNQPRAALEEFRMACKPDAILSLIQRVREADSNLAFALNNETINAASYKLGRAEALEEAVRVMQVAPCEYDGHAEGHVENMTRARCVQAIRALGEKAG